MSPDLIQIERSGYTLLDLLSDIGGIQGLMMSLFGFMVNFLNNGFLDHHLAGKLYSNTVNTQTDENAPL